MDSAHPDLAPNMWRNAGESGPGRESNGLDDDLNGHVDDWRGWDFVSGDNDPADENGHGTHVAGHDRRPIAATASAWRALRTAREILPLRVLDGDRLGPRLGRDPGLRVRVPERGAKVVNLSLGVDDLLARRARRDRGVPDACCSWPRRATAGADGVGDDNDAVATYPCAYLLPNVLCVAASDNRDRLAGFSNYGATSVDLAAPGVAIASTWPGGGYSWSSGTSMATPHVSGAAALLWAAAPDALSIDINSALALARHATPGRRSPAARHGGRLNVLRSLRLVADVGSARPRPSRRPAAPAARGPVRRLARLGLVRRGHRRRRAPRLSVRIVRGQSLSPGCVRSRPARARALLGGVHGAARAARSAGGTPDRCARRTS